LWPPGAERSHPTASSIVLAPGDRDIGLAEPQ